MVIDLKIFNVKNNFICPPAFNKFWNTEVLSE